MTIVLAIPKKATRRPIPPKNPRTTSKPRKNQRIAVSWSESVMIEAADGSFWRSQGVADKRECWTNCAPVVDRDSGRIVFFYALNEGSRDQRATRVFYRYSDDDGRTWLPTAEDGGRIEVTGLLDDNPHGWSFHMPGPGHGIQLQRQRDEHAAGNGRMLVQVWHRRAVTDDPRRYGVSLLASDDGGRSWRHTGDVGIGYGMNESRLVELDDGRVLLNARGGKCVRDGETHDYAKLRVEAVSEDGGESFGTCRLRRDFDYSFNGCDSSMIRYRPTDAAASLVLFSRPADPDARARMTVSVSADAGATWQGHHLLHAGPSFYSDLVALPDGGVGLLYGQGASRIEMFPQRVVFARLPRSWLER